MPWVPDASSECSGRLQQTQRIKADIGDLRQDIKSLGGKLADIRNIEISEIRLQLAPLKWLCKWRNKALVLMLLFLMIVLGAATTCVLQYGIHEYLLVKHTQDTITVSPR